MFQHLDDIELKFERLTNDLADPAITSNAGKLQKTAKERSQLEPVVETYRAFKTLRQQVEDNEALLADPELREMAKEELPRLRTALSALEEKLKLLLVPKDPNDERNVILEIRAGTGGDEAGLFAGELMRMYLRYAERRGWRAEIADLSEGNAGGVKEVIVNISGDSVYSGLKYESGVHRVQRVPQTEAQGRIHTSTVTVAVMPEAEDVDIQISEADILFEKFRSTGSGGQSVNTTDSAVRLTHKPTGVIVKCQQEKSQTKNRAMAMKMLRARLYEMEQTRQKNERDSARKSQVGSGERSEKIRTYNFPQDRITDHRIGVTRHNLPAYMDGDLHDMLEACRAYFNAQQLKQASGGGEGDAVARA
ncbi:MAG: peptide chain release factor 1 [Deltaproteobacteria bacterium]|nr:peptide chain release factor 1 [Deltaproteobacteria bacterium]